MVYKDVGFGNLLLLQIGLQGYLNHKMKMYLLFRQNKIMRIQGFLPSEGGEGGFARLSIWDADIAEAWPGDFLFLRVVTLVQDNLCFFPVATSVRVGASWPMFGLSAGRA